MLSAFKGFSLQALPFLRVVLEPDGAFTMFVIMKKLNMKNLLKKVHLNSVKLNFLEVIGSITKIFIMMIFLKIYKYYLLS